MGPESQLLLRPRAVAQLVEQRSPKPQVAGSSPVRPASNIKLKEETMSDTPYEASEDLVEKAKTDRASRRSPSGRIALFFKQVVAELKKVTRPTNKELLNYTGVVLGFVTVVIAVVFLLDLGFFNLVSFAFTPTK